MCAGSEGLRDLRYHVINSTKAWFKKNMSIIIQTLKTETTFVTKIYEMK